MQQVLTLNTRRSQRWTRNKNIRWKRMIKTNVAEGRTCSNCVLVDKRQFECVGMRSRNIYELLFILLAAYDWRNIQIRCSSSEVKFLLTIRTFSVAPNKERKSRDSQSVRVISEMHMNRWQHSTKNKAAPIHTLKKIALVMKLWKFLRLFLSIDMWKWLSRKMIHCPLSVCLMRTVGNREDTEK